MRISHMVTLFIFVSGVVKMHGMDDDQNINREIASNINVEGSLCKLESLDQPFLFNNENTCVRQLLLACLRNPQHSFMNAGVGVINQEGNIEKKSVRDCHENYDQILKAAQFIFVTYAQGQAKFPYMLWLFNNDQLDRQKGLLHMILSIYSQNAGTTRATRSQSAPLMPWPVRDDVLVGQRTSSSLEFTRLDPSEWPV